MVRGGCLLPFLESIRSLKAAEPLIDCEDIRIRLGLPVKAEQVRRFCHRFGIPVNPKHTKFRAKHHLWKGGRIVDKNGYVLLLRPDHPNANSNGYVREHRLVMEAAIGRHLRRDEVVHHVDGDRQHNVIGNLRLYAANRDHLAETLKGQRPNWSDEGRRRISTGASQQRRREYLARTASRQASGIDDAVSQRSISRETS